jgi:phage gp29-like protein
MEWELRRLEASDNEFNIIKEVFQHLNVTNIMDQALNTPLFGFTVFEIIWSSYGDLILPERIEEKPQEWFYFDLNNQLLLKNNLNSAYMTGIPTDPLKFILLQHKSTYMNPYGERLLSRCFWPVTFKRGGIKFWITFIEKYGQPWTIGKHPRGASQQDIDNFLNQLENMVQDAVATIPDDSSIEIIEAQKSTSSEVFKILLDFFNNEISKAILTQTLTTDITDKGTYAAASVMSKMLDQIILSDKRIIENLFNRLIQLIYEINFNSNSLPEFILYKPADVDKLLAERDEILTRTGIKFTKQYYVKNYNLSEDDFSVGIGDTSFSEPLNYSQSPSDRGDSGIIDQLSDQFLQMQIENTLKPIFDLIENGESYEVLMENLAKIYPQMNTNQLEDLLAKLIFVAEINGRTRN